MDYKKYKEEIKQNWLDQNAKHSQLMSTSMISVQPDLGAFIKVDKLEIYEDIFPEEFKQITTSYFKVIHKLAEHYRNKK